MNKPVKPAEPAPKPAKEPSKDYEGWQNIVAEPEPYENVETPRPAEKPD